MYWRRADDVEHMAGLGASLTIDGPRPIDGSLDMFEFEGSKRADNGSGSISGTGRTGWRH